MTPIRIDNVSKHFGTAAVVERVSLQVAAGELFFLLGPSGCGKTTLLRILAGFVEPDAGEIFLGDRRITHLPPRDRATAMVFQTYALWPHLTVARNVAYGLRVRGVGRQEVTQRVDQALKLVHMEGFGDRRPNQLSGGQQQRIALARALVIGPQVLLLDEPLSNLDARLRDEMREEIRRLHRETGLTMVYVTHDQKEALALAGRLAVMQNGKLVQVGAPAEVYHRPINRFVAGFLGDSNFVSGTMREAAGGQGTVDTPLGSLVGVAQDNPKPGARVVCSIRPQAFVAGVNPAGPNRIAATVEQVAFLGEVLQIHLRAGDRQLTMVSLPYQAGELKPHDVVTLTVAPDQVVILPEE